MRTLTPRELEPGMVAVHAIVTPLGQELAPAGAEITRQLIIRMKLYRVETCDVEGEPPAVEVPVAEPVEVQVLEPVMVMPTPVIVEPVPAPVPEKKVPKTHAEESKTHFQKIAGSAEFHEFQLGYLSTVELLKKTLHEIIYNHAEVPAQELIMSVSNLYSPRNTIIELFDMLYNMRTLNDSVFSHSLNVALISRMIGRWLKYDKHDLDTLTLAGLLHDIGKCKIPEEILNKPGKLTDEEFAEIKKHPKYGYDLLKNLNVDSRVKKAALMHHERCDGSGYPSGLDEDLLDEFAMIVAVADVYDAMTAARAHRAPLCPFQVIANFEQDSFQKYPTKILLTFLKQMANTYQSNRVVLSDGRGCKIVYINSNALSRPIVQFDDNTCLDLSKHRELYIKALL